MDAKERGSGDGFPLRRQATAIMSPLRYPGAKRRLASYVHDVLRLNKLKPRLFVEPFAGGASVALNLLKLGAVEKIALGEQDPLVAGFWKVVFSDCAWLCKRVKQIAVTLETWDRFRDGVHRTNRERALACLFLNRTSFSGILAPTAGPIGGRNQKSDYSIDCRFNRDRIVRRLTDVAALKDRVAFVEHGDWKTTVARATRTSTDGVFFYFDPPFYEKADRLYAHHFSAADHVRFRDAVIALRSNWVVSYDAAPEVKKLYSTQDSAKVGLVYSAAASMGLRRRTELIISNVKQLPGSSRVWRTSKEWKDPAARVTNEALAVPV